MLVLERMLGKNQVVRVMLCDGIAVCECGWGSKGGYYYYYK